MSRLIFKFKPKFAMLAQDSAFLKKEREFLKQIKKVNALDLEKAYSRYLNKRDIIDKDIEENRKKQTQLKNRFSEQMLFLNTQLTYHELKKLYEIMDGPLI